MEIDPCLSPDGRSLLFTGDAAGNQDIYLLRVGGANPLNLTPDTAEDDRHAAFSPDGGTIAFRSERDGGGIYLMGGTGESSRRITDFGYRPAWSPDGSFLVVETEGWTIPLGRSTQSTLWMVEVPSGRKHQLATGDAVQPAVSPHGLRIAYWGVPRGTGQRDIWTVAVAGGDPVPVTSDAPVDWNPVWAPDGQHLFFISDRSGTMNVWQVPLEESSGTILGPAVPVTAGAAEVAGLSIAAGDGSRLVFCVSSVISSIQKLGFDAGEGRLTGKSGWVVRDASVMRWIDPSPDGAWLATTNGTKQEDLLLISSDGARRRYLTRDSAKDRMPRWSPDGRQIAFYSDRGGSYEIWSIRPDGSGLRQLTDTPGRSAIYPLWSPDGRRLLFQDLRRGRGIIFDPAQPWNEQTPETLPKVGPGEWMETASWSPDGSRLAGVVRPLSGTRSRGLATYDLSTRTFRRLTDHGTDPLWLPDGQHLLYRWKEENFLLDLISGNSRPIDFRDPDALQQNTSLTDDGSTLFVLRYSSDFDIWMIRRDL